MRNRQKSFIFWIFFLIVVVAILVLLFMPQYGTISNASEKLRLTQARNVATNLTAFTAANYTQRKANSNAGIALTNCNQLANFAGGHLPKGYEINDQPIAADTVVFCILKGPGFKPIKFSAIGIN